MLFITVPFPSTSRKGHKLADRRPYYFHVYNFLTLRLPLVLDYESLFFQFTSLSLPFLRLEGKIAQSEYFLVLPSCFLAPLNSAIGGGGDDELHPVVFGLCLVLVIFNFNSLYGTRGIWSQLFTGSMSN